jgi:hypothetical protein
VIDLAVPGPADPVPGRGGPERRRRPRPDGTGPSRVEVALVRAGSAQHREAAVPVGHERSRPVRGNRRSPHLPGPDLGEWCRETAGSNPTSPAAAHQLRDTRTDRPRGVMSSKHPPSSAWFEHAACWGTTMPVTGTARLYRGMSLAQTPPGLPLTRRLPRAGLACRGAAGGGLLASQGPRRGAPLPPRAGVPGPRLVHMPSEPSGS